MPEQTDKLELSTFEQGDDWATSGDEPPNGYNDTVALFDELAIERGPIADRPGGGWI